MSAHAPSDGGETNGLRPILRSDREGRLTIPPTIFLKRDVFGRSGAFRQEPPHLRRGVAFIKGCTQDNGVSIFPKTSRNCDLRVSSSIHASSADLARGAALSPRPKPQILPTRSNEGFRVSPPSFHFAGQTSPGCDATYCAACTFSISSSALRPTPRV